MNTRKNIAKYKHQVWVFVICVCVLNVTGVGILIFGVSRSSYTKLVYHYFISEPVRTRSTKVLSARTHNTYELLWSILSGALLRMDACAHAIYFVLLLGILCRKCCCGVLFLILCGYRSSYFEKLLATVLYALFGSCYYTRSSWVWFSSRD